MLNLEKARKELEEKSYHDIQRETAWSWASRAAVNYEFVLEAAKDQKVSAWTQAEEYAHEAIEHASLVEKDGPKLLKEIQDAIKPYQEKAIEHIEKLLEQDLSEEKK